MLRKRRDIWPPTAASAASHFAATWPPSLHQSRVGWGPFHNNCKFDATSGWRSLEHDFFAQLGGGMWKLYDVKHRRPSISGISFTKHASNDMRHDLLLRAVQLLGCFVQTN